MSLVEEVSIARALPASLRHCLSQLWLFESNVHHGRHQDLNASVYPYLIVQLSSDLFLIHLRSASLAIWIETRLVLFFCHHDANSALAMHHQF